MAKSKGKQTITEAVNHLSAMAELDTLPAEMVEPQTNPEAIKEVFRTLFSYLEHIYKKDKEKLKEPLTQRGIKAMMTLAGEAATKLDRFSNVFKGTAIASVTNLKEFKDLQELYQNKIRQRIHETLAREEAFEEEWRSTPADMFDAERRGLKNLEMVRRDRRYELFNIKNEDGTPFFNKNLLRHIKLLGDFDESVVQAAEEDYLQKIQISLDRDIQGSAKEILQMASSSIGEFYKEAFKQKDRELVRYLGNALMALMLAGNPRNLILNTTAKNCLKYYEDFHDFLRIILRTPEFRQLSSQSDENLQGFARVLVNLTLALSGAYFTRSSHRDSAVDVIHRMILQGAREYPEPHAQVHQPLLMWNSLLDADQEMRSLLQKYPSGPVLKVFDLLSEGAGAEIGFDPLAQNNHPYQIFTYSDDQNHVTLLHLPSPTRQEYINRAEVVDEFKAFMKFLKARGGAKKHLLINLQDRTSWEEHARCHALEKLQNDEEYTDNLYVVTLPKDTEFYLQSADYLEVNDAETFITQLKDQLVTGEQCGFYFPPKLQIKNFDRTVDELIEKIHRHFFQNKKELTRNNRLDFIEIFYHLFTLNLIEWVHPDTLSFTCKDGIDAGAAASAGFFAFLRMMAGREPFSEKEKEQIMWMFNSPALTVRNRLIDPQRIHRSISCLAHMHTEFDEHEKELTKAFDLPSIKLKEE